MQTLIPRLKPCYDHREIIAALFPAKKSVENFEREFAAKFERRYGVMFPYGRSGLYALFKTWELVDCEVVCPAYTCVVVAHSIVLSGNIPVFVDCEENSFNMSYDGIRNAITEKTRAIVVTHLFGNPMNVSKVDEIIKEAEDRHGHKIHIIQDVAHAFGAKWKGELVTKYGDAAIFGLNISKLINSIFGGMVITNNDQIYNKLVEYRKKNFRKQGPGERLGMFLYFISACSIFNKYVYVYVNWLERHGFLDRFVKYYDENIISFPRNWDHYAGELEARIGRVQLGKYDDIVQKRIKRSVEYINYFRGDSRIKFNPFEDGATYSHLAGLVEDRNGWIEEYYKKGIQLGTLKEYSVPYMPAYAKYRRGEYPVSKYYSEHTIIFPNWSDNVT